MELLQNSNSEVIDTLDYRGYHIDFYNDDSGQQVYCIWEGSELGFGSYNNLYIEDIKSIIDDKLDTIKRYKWGAKLTYINNAGYRDVELIYRQRILRVWLNEHNIETEKIIAEADNLIKTIVGE